MIDPTKLWSSRSALRRARTISLEIAENLMAVRDAQPADGTVFEGAHSGAEHLRFFRDEFPQVLALLPRELTAFEAGGGLGWLAALLAAMRPEATILCSEHSFHGDHPDSEGNAHVFFRMIKEEPGLRDVVELVFDIAQDLKTCRFTDRLQFLLADAQRLPLESSSVDLVYSYNCLEHIPEPALYFREAARALRPGGVFFNATEPLYYSPFGHHLFDIYPLPWGHLLWPPEELAAMAAHRVEREWRPGERFRAAHLLEEVFPSLNGATPRTFRLGLVDGPWGIAGWREITPPQAEEWLQRMRLWEALNSVEGEALTMTALRFKLQKSESPEFSPALRLPVTVRRALKGLLKSNR